MPRPSSKALNDSLGEALNPPRRKPARATDLSDYDDDARATPVTQVTPVTPAAQGVAPSRDFTRVANSITRDAVPAGLFSGKGKQLYDYLYAKTRGAIVPVMSARLPASQVMKAAGMSRPTYKTQIARLISVGLVKIEEMGGDHGGNLFTVYLPEELGNGGYPGNQGKKLEGLPGQESYPGNRGLSSEDTNISASPQTSFKTNTERKRDDDAARLLLAKLQEAEREVVGKAGDPSKWIEPLEIMLTELKVAASRAQVISSAPRFLAEHLRRRLGKVERAPSSLSPAESSKAPVKREFTEEPCPVCKGMLTEPDPEGGKRRCTFCRDGVGYPTGRKPKDSVSESG